MSEKDLARAVLLQAIFDATSEKTSEYNKLKRPTKKEKKDAIEFLSGNRCYRERLNLFCWMCGIDESSVIKFGKTIKKGGKNVRQIYSRDYD